jgi:hypothetical protein
MTNANNNINKRKRRMPRTVPSRLINTSSSSVDNKVDKILQILFTN